MNSHHIFLFSLITPTHPRLSSEQTFNDALGTNTQAAIIMTPPQKVRIKPVIEWCNVTSTPVVLEKLELLTHTKKLLRREGYVLNPLSEKEIWKKMRCQNCGHKLKYYRPQDSHNLSDDTDNQTFVNEHYDACASDDSSFEQRYANEVARATESSRVRKHYCVFHDGNQFKGVWQCCDGQSNTEGCCSNIDHSPSDSSQLAREWLFTETPSPAKLSRNLDTSSGSNLLNHQNGGRRVPNKAKYKNIHSSHPVLRPMPNPQFVRPAVALDCEMGTSRLGNVELIRVSMIDFFTAQPLIDSLVIPNVEMAHYNTRYSGVTFAAMNKARRTNTGIRGVDAARKEVFKYVDSDTFVIVHGGSNDFTSLRWIHPVNKIIDSCVLEGYDYGVREKGWKKSLKEVCKRRCGISVQDAKLENGRAAGHDSLEDACAAREIVCWWLNMIPDE